jgi:hypothetical protein
MAVIMEGKMNPRSSTKTLAVSGICRSRIPPAMRISQTGASSPTVKLRTVILGHTGASASRSAYRAPSTPAPTRSRANTDRPRTAM